MGGSGSAPGFLQEVAVKPPASTEAPVPRPGTLPRNLILLRSLILHLSSLLAWALKSALEGDHETGVASALATSLDRTEP